MKTKNEYHLSISIHPHKLSFENYEKHYLTDVLIKYFKMEEATKYIIGWEKGKHSEQYTHYQIYLVTITSPDGIRKKLKRLFEPYHKKLEGLQKGKNLRWLKVKKWAPREKDKIQSPLFLAGYCLKECGKLETNFKEDYLQKAKKYYKFNLKEEQLDIKEICKECTCTKKRIMPMFDITKPFINPYRFPEKYRKCPNCVYKSYPLKTPRDYYYVMNQLNYKGDYDDHLQRYYDEYIKK